MKPLRIPGDKSLLDLISHGRAGSRPEYFDGAAWG